MLLRRVGVVLVRVCAVTESAPALGWGEGDDDVNAPAVHLHEELVVGLRRVH